MDTEIDFYGPKKQADDRPWHQSVISSLLSFSALSNLLRILGAGVIVTALSIFLMQGWQNGDDIHRYLLLLGQTFFLAVIGFVCNHWIRETKGARLFLCLALVSVPINFAILGGLIFSQVQWDMAQGMYPHFAHWQAQSLSDVMLTSVAAIIVLLPILWIGFLVLARRSSTMLASLFFISNAFLLIPLRSAEFVGIFLLALTGLVLWQLSRISRNDATLMSTEGRFAQLVQLLPVAMIAVRALTLYAFDYLLMASVALGVFIMLRHLALSFSPESPWRKLVDQLSLIPATFGAIGITAFASETFAIAPMLMLPLFTICLTTLILELSLRSPKYGAALRRLASIVVSVTLIVNLVLYSGVASAALCMLAGIALFIYGYSAQQRVVFTLGILTLVIGVGYQIYFVTHHFDLSGWASLAALGVGAILSASILERHGALIKHRLTCWLGEYRSWEY